MHYTRLYADANGVSHFEDVEIALAPANFAPPAPPLIMSEPVPSTATVFCALPAGWTGDWHPAPRRQYYLQLSGVMEVEVSDGETRRFSPGDIVLLEDVTGKGHVTRVLGSELRCVFIQLPE